MEEVLPISPSLLSPSLLQKFEQISILIQRLCDQYRSTVTYFLQSLTPTETRSLTYNTQTLSSQLQTALSICSMYRSIHPLFCCIASSLSQYDVNTLYTLLTTYSSDLWKILEQPLPEVVQASTISFITNIDSFITTFLIQHSTTSLALHLSDFSSPKATNKPSIVHQVSFTEITVDPYLRALQQNYYYPLSYLTMPDSTPMHIDDAPSPDSKISSPRMPTIQATNLQKKKAITVEDSMDVISELISEIQSTDKLDLNLPPHSPQAPKPTEETKTLRFSLARTRMASPTTNFLPLLKRFLNCLLSTSSTHLLPIRNDTQLPPLKTSSQINELSATGAKLFFKASKPSSGNIAGDFHVSTPLPFEELCSAPKISSWLQLHGYYMVKCECQSSDMVKIGFLSRVRPFLWREDLRDMIKDS
jgi:hypothetical protein